MTVIDETIDTESAVGQSATGPSAMPPQVRTGVEVPGPPDA